MQMHYNLKLNCHSTHVHVALDVSALRILQRYGLATPDIS